MKKTKFKWVVVLSLALLFGSIIVASLIKQKKDKEYIPKNLNEAISQLDILSTGKDKKDIFDMTEEEYTVSSHFSTGLWIRNGWGLWSGKELAKYFNKIGIFHPDDMSGIILCCYYRHLHNQDYKLVEQIKTYKNYWNKGKEYDKRMRTDTAFVQQERLKYERMVKERIEKAKQSFPLGSKIRAFVEYPPTGKYTDIEGFVTDWREVEGKGDSLFPNFFKLKHGEAKIKVIEYMENDKIKRVEKQNEKTINELWVNIELLEKSK